MLTSAAASIKQRIARQGTGQVRRRPRDRAVPPERAVILRLWVLFGMGSCPLERKQNPEVVFPISVEPGRRITVWAMEDRSNIAVAMVY